MPPGPKPLTVDEKKLKGTFKKSRNKLNMPTQSKDRPIPPANLSPLATEKFNLLADRLEAENRLSASHTEILVLAAQRLEEIEDLAESIKEVGRVYKTVSETGSVIIRANPACSMLDKAMKHLHQALAELGLTPSAMQRVGAPISTAEKKEPNKFQLFVAK